MYTAQQTLNLLRTVDSSLSQATDAGLTKFFSDPLLAQDLHALGNTALQDSVEAALDNIGAKLPTEGLAVITDARDLSTITYELATGQFTAAANFIAGTAIDDAIASTPIPLASEALEVGKIVGLFVADYTIGYTQSLIHGL